MRVSSHEPIGSSMTDCAELIGPPGGCCIYTLLLIITPWLCAAKLFLAHPSSLSGLFRCRVLNTWGHRAAGHSVVISISIIDLLIIFTLSPKESAVGQRAEMDNGRLPPLSQCVECVRELSVCPYTCRLCV